MQAKKLYIPRNAIRFWGVNMCFKKLADWMDLKTKKMDWLDIGCVKFGSMAFALTVAKLWEPLLSQDWKVYAAIFVLAALRPAYRMYIK